MAVVALCMRFLDLTLDDPAENLALDEALLLEAEESSTSSEVLRLWESSRTFVVLGSSSQYAREARLGACERDGTPILRRPSGGAAIVTGPGCLMYSLVLSLERRRELASIDVAHAWVLGNLAAALGGLVPGVVRAGTSDLAVGGRKFSGNSLRVKRSHLLYHGTLLYRFELASIERYLAAPPRQPTYRENRGHAEFVMNLSIGGERLREAVSRQFGAMEEGHAWPRERTEALASNKYRDRAWIERV